MRSTSIKNKVNKMQGKLFYWHRRSRLLLPGICLICLEPLIGERDLCHCCKSQLPSNLICCQFCAEPLITQVEPLICNACYKAPVALNQALASWLYLPPFSQLIWEFKYTQNLAAGYLLLDLLRDTLSNKSKNYDCLVVIPGQKARIKQRGYHAPTWLAKRLALLSGLTFYKRGLKRIKDIPSQQDLGRKARWLNPRGAFKASADIAGKKVLLLDDVITTGASAHWAADELKRQGAISVDLLATAKTPAAFKHESI
ncbi:ComF family protein [Marinospirillum insulare]|uniref:Amidophosphoribosyltransferase n=1 Tax=Marinospirillum insulare TaxID=217169 RepID=A0ABQ6A3V6_9GAMM|nr:ComF family protein [Marinospirillum insulare]GLR64775.1 amidophosphoribosyltransferase [Marinospirillum insulare]